MREGRRQASAQPGAVKRHRFLRVFMEINDVDKPETLGLNQPLLSTAALLMQEWREHFNDDPTRPDTGSQEAAKTEKLLQRVGAGEGEIEKKGSSRGYLRLIFI